MGGRQHINQDLYRAFLHHDLSLEQDIPQICLRSHGFRFGLWRRGNHQ